MTVVNAANMAKCWSTRLLPSKAAAAAAPFRSALALVRPGVLVAALPQMPSSGAPGDARGAAPVLVAGLRVRDGHVLWRTTALSAPRPPGAASLQFALASPAAVMLAAGERLVFVAAASVVTALALGTTNSSVQQPVQEWQWTAPHGSSVTAMQPLGADHLAVGLSSGAVLLLSFSSTSRGATITWREQVTSGGEAAALTLAPAGWASSPQNGSVLLVSTKEAHADGSPLAAAADRGRVVALSADDGGLLWATAAPTPQAPLTAAGGCAPTAVSAYVPPPSAGPLPNSALLNGTIAVFGCPDSVHAVSSAGELVWSLALSNGIGSVIIGQDGLIYGWSQGVISIDAS